MLGEPTVGDVNEMENEWTLWNLADEFFFAAKELGNSYNPDRVEKASYYLCAHSLELAFKCYLHRKGVSLDELKRDYGHDLVKALSKAKQFGFATSFGVDSKYEQVVTELNKYYSVKDLEYMKINGKLSIPPLSDIKELVDKTLGVLAMVLSDHL